MVDQRADFYKGIAYFRRRRRRTVPIYHSEADLYAGAQTIKISNTMSYEEAYSKINNVEPFDPTKPNISPVVQFAATTTAVSYYKKKADEAAQKSKKREKTKTRRPIITEQGQEHSTGIVEYTDKLGRKYYKQGGTMAWRHNNPGNLSYSSLEVAKRHGAVDVVLHRDESGKIIHRFGVFPNAEAGEKAMREFLKERGSSYFSNGAPKSIATFIGNTYAPKSDNNNVTAYSEFVRRHSGIDVYNRNIASLNKIEFNRLVEAMKEYEKATPGQILTSLPK